ncbi:ATP-binding cassette domain-containing protein, partial [Acinetobacter baumannii]
LGMVVPGFTSHRHDEPALDALSAVGLQGFEDRPYQQLSGGERQRVHIARALCQLNTAPARSKQALFLDEPTSSLDPAHQAIVLELLRREAE